MSDPGDPSPPILGLRAEAMTYAVAFLSISLQPMANVVVPLWALSMGVPPLLLGIAMGARSLLPFLFAIHGGVLIDRLGVRRVMVFCALASALISILYPALPWIGPLIALQVCIGMFTTMGWIGSQTHTGRITGGHPRYMGRFTFASTIANFFGPLAVGMAWDVGGPWGAFGFISAWSLALAAGCAALSTPPGTAETSDRSRLASLLPSLADYRSAFALMLLPAVGFVVAASFLINATFSMRFAFYVVYLKVIGLEGTLIGLLVGISSLSGAVFALLIGPATRRFDGNRLLVIMIVVAAAGIGGTPLFTDLTGLFLLACLFGLGTGLGMALIYVELSRSAPAHRLGASIGLRTTANRFSSLSIPVLMGTVVEFGGMNAGFYAVALLIILAAVMARLLLLRHPRAAVGNIED